MASSLSPPAAFSYLNLSSSSIHRFVRWPKRIRSSQKMLSRASLTDDSGLREAAKYTVDKHIKSGMTVGLGSGQASTIAIQYLGRQLRAGALKDVVGIPMSAASASEAAKSGIPLDQYQQESSHVDFAFDDADTVEEGSLISVIGRHRLQGDESILQEKSILKAANDLVFIIKEKLYKSNVDGSIPVLVQSLNWIEIAEEIDDLFLGDAEVWRRAAIGYAGPLGGDFPVITMEGHHVLDVIFTSPIPNLADVAESLAKINGVVEHGVICGLQCTAVVVSDNGLRIVDNLPKNVMKEL